MTNNTLTLLQDLAIKPVTTATSLVLPDELEYNEWEQIGNYLQQVQQSAMWWIGDWLQYGEKKYGQTVEASQITGYAFQTLADASWVAGKFETSRRREVLPFSFHKEVAGIKNINVQDALLDECERNQWTQKELRKAITAFKHEGKLNEIENELKALPAGQYHTIIIDPPWQIKHGNLDERHQNKPSMPYPTMSKDELLGLTLATDDGEKTIGEIATDDAHLFMWCTQSTLLLALQLCEVWAFKYSFLMTWKKPAGFQPINRPQFNSEFIVYARKGNPLFNDTKSFATCYEWERGEHSKKPEQFYELIRRVCMPPRLDVFSRRQIEGFDVYGNEV